MKLIYVTAETVTSHIYLVKHNENRHVYRSVTCRTAERGLFYCMKEGMNVPMRDQITLYI